MTRFECALGCSLKSRQIVDKRKGFNPKIDRGRGKKKNSFLMLIIGCALRVAWLLLLAIYVELRLHTLLLYIQLYFEILKNQGASIIVGTLC